MVGRQQGLEEEEEEEVCDLRRAAPLCFLSASRSYEHARDPKFDLERVLRGLLESRTPS